MRSCIGSVKAPTPGDGHRFGAGGDGESGQRSAFGTIAAFARLFCMIDVLESAIAPSAIERALEIFEKFKDRDRAELVQARKALTDHTFGLIAAGETDEQRLVVSGLSHLKSLERMVSAEAKKVGSQSGGVPGEPERKSLPDATSS